DHLAWLDRGIVGVAMLMTYFIARFWGSLLPYLADFGIAADGLAGMRTALLYLSNILGSAAGSIVTGFVLMDHLGLVDVGAALVIAGLLCAVLLIAALHLPRAEKSWRMGLTGALGAIAVFVIPVWSAHVLENLQWKGSPDAKPFIDLVENRSGIITVAA